MIDFRAVPDEDLYEMCVRGDDGAWKYLYNYILTICRWTDIDDPEDMTSKVTVELLEKALKKVEKKDRFRYFIKVMTRNRIIDSFKSSSKKEIAMSRLLPDDDEEEDDQIPEIGSSEPDQIDKVFRAQVFSIVENAIECLPSACRRIIKEYFKFKLGLYEDYKELSKVLKIPVPTISSKVTRCMRILVECPQITALKAVM
jgi:RNA polymerase sigma factor (sigma-70 family)